MFPVSAVASLGLFAVPGAWVYAAVAMAGTGRAGMQMPPMSMPPDVISDHENATTGFVSSTGGDTVTQSGGAITGIVPAVPAVPRSAISSVK
ncbi:hypothetical protein [Rhodococcus marinonascens]|uniref:hypothetical protein n=1 Tax=Rhodococcus marinonascens TaxID=38311 RepID=UPI000934448D|nr:hypothetical protein [Rhodococcus marinonascens]